MSIDWVGDIEEMHRKFFGDKPKLIAAMSQEMREAYMGFRIKFMAEEFQELLDANHPEDVVDAIIDLCVVAIGTLHAFGVCSGTAWNRVLDANMAKQAGSNPKRPNPFNLPDLIKPEGWTPPNHSDNIGLIVCLPKEEVPQ